MSFQDAAAPRKHGDHSAREIVIGSLGADPYERMAQLEELGAKKAEANGRAYHMEHMRKVVLSHVATELSAIHANEKLSEAKLERLARADDRYREHIEATALAIEARDKAEAAYWTLKAGLEWDARAISHMNSLARMDGQP